jgi:hypothetical protein
MLLNRSPCNPARNYSAAHDPSSAAPARCPNRPVLTQDMKISTSCLVHLLNYLIVPRAHRPLRRRCNSHSRLFAGDDRRLPRPNFLGFSMTTPPNPSPLLSSRPNPSLPLHRRPRFPHSPAAANTTGAASAPDWFRPRRTPDSDPSISGGRVTARDPGVRVKAKEGAEEEKDKKAKRRRWWERWSGDKESYLVDDVEPLPIPLTVPETEPMSREELDRRLSCDVEIDVSSACLQFLCYFLAARVWAR